MGNPSLIPPQKEALYPDRIPEELKKIAHWVIWRWEQNEKQKWTKPPYTATNPNHKASSTDPDTWRKFDEAVQAYKDNLAHGIGFVLSNHPQATDLFAAVDLDQVYDPAVKKIIDQKALDFVNLCNSYTEITPSRRGIRIFGYVDPVLKSLKGIKRKSYEIYFRERFVSTTGMTHAVYTHQLTDITNAAQQIISDLKGSEKESENGNGSTGHTNLADAEIIKRASKQNWKFNKLFAGDWSTYQSQSEADLALCSILAFWSNRDPHAIDRIFRMSGLYREKWEREDYRVTTIEKAIAGTHDTYKPKTEERSSYIEWAPSFLSIEDPPEKYKIPQLGPESAIMLPHGEPRLLKTWCVQALLLSASLGIAPFGLERFKPEQPLRVWYASQEDGAKKVRARLKRLLLGMGINEWPENLAFSIHKGINLDLGEWQNRLIDDAIKHNIDVLALDPIRRFSENVDKGPSEVRTLTGYLRRFAEATRALTVPVHHDVKPNGQREDRRRGHNASGGDWFAASDCPIAFESAGKNKTLVIPEDYKFSEDPKAFTLELIDLDNGGIQVIGKDADAKEAKELVLQEKVKIDLEQHPHSSTTAIQQRIHVRRDDLNFTLAKMLEEGFVDQVKKGSAKLWFLTGKE